MSSTAPTTILSAVSDRNSARYSLFSTAPSLGPSIAATAQSSTTLLNEKTATTMAAPQEAKLPNSAESTPTPSRSASQASVYEARAAELKSWAATIERLSDQRLERQRFVPTNNKNDELATNAIGAKLERALGRRMSGQDAVFKRRPVGEKSPVMAS